MNKLVAAILIILLLGGALFYLLYRNGPQKAVPPTPTGPIESTSVPTDDLDKTAIYEVTTSFYEKYDSCMKNPPAEATGKVGEYCQNNSGLTTSAFADNLEKGGTAKAGADPIICAQNMPESITVNPEVQITVNKGVVFVSEKLGQSQIEIHANLLKENGSWKIDNIVCPLP